MGGSIGARRRGRECALQVLYSLDLNASLTTAQALAHYWRAFQGDGNGDGETQDPSIISFAEELVNGSIEHQAEIDDIIQRASKNWRLDRMARVDRNLLRLATFELSFQPDVPAKVVINEAIEVAKRYGTAESPAFVNGLLDRISQELKRS
jgi:transcription antitermination protein NusB